MLLSQILHKIKQIHHDKLPGIDAQLKMSPPMRLKYDEIDLEKLSAKESAVVVLLYEKLGETHIVFTQRHISKGAHSGQISFPGGKRDEEDKDLKMTALRELGEEVGVELDEEKVLLALSWLYVPPSNFVIYPFVAYLDKAPVFVKEEAEVKEILEFKVVDLLDEINHKKYNYFNENLQISFETPSFQIDNYVIWGATAMILSEFLNIIES